MDRLRRAVRPLLVTCMAASALFACAEDEAPIDPDRPAAPVARDARLVDALVVDAMVPVNDANADATTAMDSEIDGAPPDAAADAGAVADASRDAAPVVDAAPIIDAAHRVRQR